MGRADRRRPARCPANWPRSDRRRRGTATRPATRWQLPRAPPLGAGVRARYVRGGQRRVPAAWLVAGVHKRRRDRTVLGGPQSSEEGESGKAGGSAVGRRSRGTARARTRVAVRAGGAGQPRMTRSPDDPDVLAVGFPLAAVRSNALPDLVTGTVGKHGPGRGAGDVRFGLGPAAPLTCGRAGSDIDHGGHGGGRGRAHPQEAAALRGRAVDPGLRDRDRDAAVAGFAHRTGGRASAWPTRPCWTARSKRDMTASTGRPPTRWASAK